MKTHPWCWAVRDWTNDSIIQLLVSAASDSQKMRETQPGLSDTLKGMPPLEDNLLFLSLPFPPDLVYWWEYSGSDWVGLLLRKLCFFSLLYLGRVRKTLKITSGLLFLTQLCSSGLWNYFRQWNTAKFYNFWQNSFKLICLHVHFQHMVLKLFDIRLLKTSEYQILWLKANDHKQKDLWGSGELWQVEGPQEAKNW